MIFVGGYAGNFLAGLGFLPNWRLGQPTDMTLPAKATKVVVEVTIL